MGIIDPIETNGPLRWQILHSSLPSLVKFIDDPLLFGQTLGHVEKDTVFAKLIYEGSKFNVASVEVGNWNKVKNGNLCNFCA